jgi:iron complex outermembrane receptor protein
VTPTFNTGGLVSLCSGGSPSRLPLWNLSVQSEYDHPIMDNVDGFIRGLLNYTPQNKYIEPNFVADSYSLVNLYVGARSHDGAWEVSLFAKNAFKNQTQLDQGQTPYNLNSSLSSNFQAFNVPSTYSLATTTPRREVGLNVHYAWGAR